MRAMYRVVVGSIKRRSNKIVNPVEVQAINKDTVECELSGYVGANLAAVDFITIQSSVEVADSKDVAKLKAIARRYEDRYAYILDNGSFLGLVKVNPNDVDNDAYCRKLLYKYFEEMSE